MEGLDAARAKPSRHLPVVLSRDEARRLLAAAAEGTTGLMLALMYGTGLRLMECLRLRVKDVDFDRNVVLVRDGKGGKDRQVMLPQSLKARLAEHRERLEVLWGADRAAGRARAARWTGCSLPRMRAQFLWKKWESCLPPA